MIFRNFFILKLKGLSVKENMWRFKIVLTLWTWIDLDKKISNTKN